MKKSKAAVAERKAARAEKRAYLMGLLENPDPAIVARAGVLRMGVEGRGEYSIKNTILILTQRPDATQVAGFNQWKELGRYVRKGAKGISILVPMARKPKDDGEDAGVFFGIGYVFDVSDTDPIEQEQEVAA